MIFKNILIISIRPERLAECLSRCGLTSELSRHTFNIIHVDCVDGKTLDMNNLIKTKQVVNSTDPAVPEMTRGQVGCFMSHRNAWKYIVENQLDSALIIEDDVDFKQDIHKFISDVFEPKWKILNETLIKEKYKWDVLYLGRNHKVAVNLRRFNNHIVIPGLSWGLFCYAIKKRAADYLWNLSKTTITEAVDTWICTDKRIRKVLFFAAFDPSLVDIIPVTSDTAGIK